MAERARWVGFISDDAGDIIPSASIEVRQSGTATKITETIFSADDPAPGQLTNPFTSDINGRCEFYLTNHKRCDLFVTKAGFSNQTIPVDVQKSSLVSGYATVQDEGGALSQQATLNFTGTGVTAADDAANGRTNVTIPGAGTVATDAIWDAVGDLAKGTGADTAARLARGTANQSLRINATGTDIEWGGFVGARVFRTTNQSIANDIDVVLSWTSERFDHGNMWDAGAPTRLTVPTGRSGLWHVGGLVNFAINGTGYRRVDIDLNNLAIARVADSAVSGLVDHGMSVATVVNAVAGDRFELFAAQTSGGALDMKAGDFLTHFFATYLGPA